MDALRISRLHAHYRLPADAPDAAPRLGRVLREVLDEGVEHALARLSVPVHEEICIRAAHAPVHLKSASADTTLIGTWSVGLADSIQRTIRDGGPDVVRYRTRNHALVDLLAGVAAGDFRHAWAWRTLGLWTIDDQPSPDKAGREAVRALLAHPESVVAVLAGAARVGALARLAGAVPHSGWLELARAALSASSISPELAQRLVSEGGLYLRGPAAPWQERSDGAGGPSRVVVTEGALATPEAVRAADNRGADVGPRAMRIAGRSEIARALRTVPLAQERLAWILCVLAVLEADPSALQGGGTWASALVGHVLREALGEEERHTAGRDDARGVRKAGKGPGTPDPERGRSHRGRAMAQDPGKDGSGTEGTDGVPEATGTSDRDAEAGAVGSERAPTGPDRALDAPTRADIAPDDAPEAITTEWGGLLFLLHVVDELGLPAEISAADVFRARSLAWVLHGVAGCLLHLDRSDPAATAFAGVVPGRLPPWDGDDQASLAEQRALENISRRVADRAHERLVGETPSDARTAAATVRACARRRADLLCETGWFDVLLRLDEVVVETRRAGLDLDPGWIPWLGAVVRFIYV